MHHTLFKRQQFLVITGPAAHGCTETPGTGVFHIEGSRCSSRHRQTQGKGVLPGKDITQITILVETMGAGLSRKDIVQITLWVVCVVDTMGAGLPRKDIAQIELCHLV